MKKIFSILFFTGTVIAFFLFRSDPFLIFENDSNFPEATQIIGSARIEKIESGKIVVSEGEYKKIFNLTENFKVFIDPRTERSEELDRILTEDGSCSEINFSQIDDQLGLREISLEEVEKGEEVYFFTSGIMDSINHLIIER